MKVAILHHPSDAAATLVCSTHLALLRGRGHVVETCTTEAFVTNPQPVAVADIVILILSAPFAEWWTETPSTWRIEARRAGDRATLLPVRLRACEMPVGLRGVHPVPGPYDLRLSIAELPHPDEGWVLVARAVQHMIAALERGAP